MSDVDVDVEMTISPEDTRTPLVGPSCGNTRNLRAAKSTSPPRTPNQLESPFAEVGDPTFGSISPSEHRTTRESSTNDPVILRHDWLLLRNNDLHGLIQDNGKTAQAHMVMFNDLWQRFTALSQANEVLNGQKQGLSDGNNQLIGKLGQVQHALALERHKGMEKHRLLAFKEGYINSLQQDLSMCRERNRQTQEHATLVTQALLTVAHAPTAGGARSATRTSYESQLRENERLREDLALLLAKMERGRQALHHAQPTTYSGQPSQPVVQQTQAILQHSGQPVGPPQTVAGWGPNSGRLVPPSEQGWYPVGPVTSSRHSMVLPSIQATTVPQVVPTLQQPSRRKDVKNKK